MNTVQLTGRIIEAPELHTLSDGTSVCNLRLAVKHMGREHRTGFIDVQTFGKLARACAGSLCSGWIVAITGRLEYGEWEDAAGSRCSGHSIAGRVVKPVELRRGRPITRPRSSTACGDRARDVA